jgi:hypothetical protein
MVQNDCLADRRTFLFCGLMSWNDDLLLVEGFR